MTWAVVLRAANKQVLRKVLALDDFVFREHALDFGVCSYHGILPFCWSVSSGQPRRAARRSLCSDLPWILEMYLSDSQGPHAAGIGVDLNQVLGTNAFVGLRFTIRDWPCGQDPSELEDTDLGSRQSRIDQPDPATRMQKLSQCLVCFEPLPPVAGSGQLLDCCRYLGSFAPASARVRRPARAPPPRRPACLLPWA